MTISTVHSHHHFEWDHTDSHVNTGHCLTDSTNLCPICGYLFNADVADRDTYSTQYRQQGCVTAFIEPQQHAPFSGAITGRSPPLG